MNKNSRKHRGALNSKAALNTLIVESQPYYYYGGDGDILPYGVDNLYPERIERAIENSPTGMGCIDRLKYFVKGHGFIGGNFPVNRSGEYLNDILELCVDDYVKFNGFSLHFNFNLIGQIVEIFNIPIEYLRKNRCLTSVQMGIWDYRHQLYTNEFIKFDLYGKCNPIERMKYGGYKTYKGQVMYFSKDGRIYPNSTAQTCSLSAEYEGSVQLYSLANVKNNFSANTIIKLPTMYAGEKGQSQVDTLQENLKKMHGAGNAGGSVVVPVLVGATGESKDFKMIENLTPTSVDDIFVNQNENGERTILKTYMMPEILLGISSSGMFNESSFNDAFNYKNADTEQDRKIIERQFRGFLEKSIFKMDQVEIQPLDMRGQVLQSDGGEELSQETVKAQAGLRGSVGGVQGVLQIQREFSEGITSFSSAISILEIIFGFSKADAIRLLGQPEKQQNDG